MASREELGRLDLMPKSDIDKLGQLLTNAESLISLLDGGSSGGSFVVTITESDGTYSADKTIEEIATAYADGLAPIVKFEADTIDNIYQLSQIDDYAVFTCVIADQYGFTASSFYIWGDGTVNYETVYYTSPTNEG